MTASVLPRMYEEWAPGFQQSVDSILMQACPQGVLSFFFLYFITQKYRNVSERQIWPTPVTFKVAPGECPCKIRNSMTDCEKRNLVDTGILRQDQHCRLVRSARIITQFGLFASLFHQIVGSFKEFDERNYTTHLCPFVTSS